MGLFGRKTAFGTTKPSLELNLTNILILMMMSLVMLQAVGLVIGGNLGAGIKLGPIVILVAVFSTSLLTVAIFKKMVSDTVIDKKDVFAIFVVGLLTILLLFFLRDFVPEIFEQSIIQLQSILGF